MAHLMGNSNTVFVLLMVKGGSKNVGHWVAIIRHENGTYSYYDPYGMTVEQDLAIAHEGGQLVKLLTQVHFDTNHVRHQQMKSHVNTCGRHCAVRSVFHELTNAQYNAKVINTVVPTQLPTADALVSLITGFLSQGRNVVRQFFK